MQCAHTTRGHTYCTPARPGGGVDLASRTIAILLLVLLLVVLLLVTTTAADSDRDPIATPAGSFAYLTVKDRLPKILTQIIDRLHRSRAKFHEEHGEEGSEADKKIISLLSKLRNELLTDKPITPLTDGRPDVGEWNAYLEAQRCLTAMPSWFTSAWLYVECYMYRRVQEAMALCPPLNDHDVFSELKQKSFFDSQKAIISLCDHLGEVLNKISGLNKDEVKKEFQQLLQVCLWGNKCDLSISAGKDNPQKASPLTGLNDLKAKILIDDTEAVWATLEDKLKKNPSSTQCFRLDIVLDNAGFELFTDLVLAEFLLASKLVDQIHFHGKCMPWFISDVTKEDVNFTVHLLMASNHRWSSKLGATWRSHLQDGSWVYHDHMFWTFPHEYCSMEAIAPDLYAELKRSNLILFKGDLNYRKLTGDRQWDHTTAFETALQGFHPSALCSLRALKADLQVGLQPGMAEILTAADPDWMVSGEYAVIQFSDAKQ
uniref:Sugar phosphate phosphatase n=2 Tax=Petromyzon marinus TaxID=7757 RepID=A0AAJ7SRQ3_PETMA|nr:damage-control phosphatase ARMT1 isoform X1 [Petromyzon marinus]